MDYLDKLLLYYAIDLDNSALISDRLQNVHKDLTIRTIIVLASTEKIYEMLDQVYVIKYFESSIQTSVHKNEKYLR